MRWNRLAEFVKVMRHKVRMCRQVATCEECPLFKEFWERDASLAPREQCHVFVGLHPDEAEPIIMAWAAEHPEKTMLDVFFEIFPKAMKRDDGTPIFCPWELGLCDAEPCPEGWCTTCWNRPALEE